jgi:methyltransferase
MVTQLAFTGLVACLGIERLRTAHERPLGALHALLLLGCVAEVWLLGRPFVPALALPMLLLVVAAQAFRWYARESHGALVVESCALPLIHGAFSAACCFTLLQAVLLGARFVGEVPALRSASRAWFGPRGPRPPLVGSSA